MLFLPNISKHYKPYDSILIANESSCRGSTVTDKIMTLDHFLCLLDTSITKPYVPLRVVDHWLIILITSHNIKSLYIFYSTRSLNFLGIVPLFLSLCFLEVRLLDYAFCCIDFWY